MHWVIMDPNGIVTISPDFSWIVLEANTCPSVPDGWHFVSVYHLHDTFGASVCVMWLMHN